MATLNEEEDVDGLRKLLDPQTLAVGQRASRLTHGPGVFSLATSMPGSPLSDSQVSFGWNRQTTISVFRTYDAPLFRAPDPSCIERA